MGKTSSSATSAYALCVALGVCAGLGCGPPHPKPIDLTLGSRSYTVDEYTRVLSRWTRHARLQNDFDAVAPFVVALDVRATFESWDWRWAYVERYADFYRLPATDKDQLRQQQLKEASEFHEFHIAANSSQYEWTDFLKPKNAMWRVVLFDDRRREIEPSERYPVKIPLAAEVAFFPYVGNLDQPFTSRVLLRFPSRFPDGTPTVSPDAKQVTLRFAGPLGTVDLVWNTIRGEPPG